MFICGSCLSFTKKPKCDPDRLPDPSDDCILLRCLSPTIGDRASQSTPWKDEEVVPCLSTLTVVLGVVCIFLVILNVYQYLARRGAQRLAEILYIISRNVSDRAREVRRNKKDVEIVEAQLQDVLTTARTLLLALGRGEETLDPDPSVTIFNGSGDLSKEGLLRMADRILFSVREEDPEANQNEVATRTLERFLVKVPNMDEDKAQKIIRVVAKQEEDGDVSRRMN